MKPVRPMRAGAINYNIADAKQLYQNHAKLISDLRYSLESLSSSVESDRESIEKTNASNHDIFVSMQGEINKLKAATSSLAKVDISATKAALDTLSATVAEIAARTDKLKDADIAALRTELSNVKKLTSEISSVKPNIGIITANVEHNSSEIESAKSDISTIQSNVSDLKTSVSGVAANVSTVSTAVDEVSADLTSFKESTLASISSIEANIDTLKRYSIDALKKELIDIVSKSLPTFSPSSSELESDSEATERDVLNVTSDYPFDIPQDDPNCDSIEVNGVYLTSTTKDGQQICSITNTFGGLAIDKQDSFDRWIIERNDDKFLKFHLNTESNPPLVLSKRGIITNRLKLGRGNVDNITNTFTSSNINHHTIPTTKAIFDFVHANMLSNNVNGIGGGVGGKDCIPKLPTGETKSNNNIVPPLAPGGVGKSVGAGSNGNASGNTNVSGPGIKASPNGIPLPILRGISGQSKSDDTADAPSTGSKSARPESKNEALPTASHVRRSSMNSSTSAAVLPTLPLPSMADVTQSQLVFDIDPDAIDSPDSGANQKISKSPSKCDISTIDIDGKHSLLIQNNSCSVSFKDNTGLYTMSASSMDGLRINDTFKLANDDGILCCISVTNIPKGCKLSDLSGLFVAYTKHIKRIQSSDDEHNTLYVPEIYIPSDATSVIVGVVSKVITSDYYTKSNRIYSLAEHRTDELDEDEESLSAQYNAVVTRPSSSRNSIGPGEVQPEWVIGPNDSNGNPNARGGHHGGIRPSATKAALTDEHIAIPRPKNVHPAISTLALPTLNIPSGGSRSARGNTVGPNTYYFITIATKGIAVIKTKEEKIGCGNLFVPSKGGYAKKVTDDKSGTKLDKFCIHHAIPRAKSITRISPDSFLGVII